MLSRLTSKELAPVSLIQQVYSRNHTTVFLCLGKNNHQLLMVI